MDLRVRQVFTRSLLNKYFWFAAITFTGVAAYWNSFQGAFVFDHDMIPEKVYALADFLWALISFGRRAYLGLTFIANREVNGSNPFGWHFVNLAIHLAAGLTLFGICRRTFARHISRFLQELQVPLAGIIAVFFVVHPLQTESVTFIWQRAESLMGLLFLLALYAVIRGYDSSRRWAWYALALLASDLALETKPHMAAAPAIFLLYDYAYLSGSFKELWRKNRGLHVAVALLWIVVFVGTRYYRTGGGDMGTVVVPRAEGMPSDPSAAISTWEYARSQFGIIQHYVWLTFWPDDLCFDYAWPVAHSIRDIVLSGIFIACLVSLTLWSCIKHPQWGFWAAWLFLLLAPSSSLVPQPNLCAEHRMYVAIAGIIVLCVAGGAEWLCLQNKAPLWWRAGIVLLLAATLGFSLRTIRRNQDYYTELSMWGLVVKQRPDNARAWYNLGVAIAGNGGFDEAIDCFREAVRISPSLKIAKIKLGKYWMLTGHPEEAHDIFKNLLDDEPNSAANNFMMGEAQLKLGNRAEAVRLFLNATNFENKPRAIELCLRNAQRIDPSAGSPMLVPAKERQFQWQPPKLRLK